MLRKMRFAGREELIIRFRNQNARHVEGFFLGFLADEGGDPLGLRFLFGCQIEVDHRGLLSGKWERISKAKVQLPSV